MAASAAAEDRRAAANTAAFDCSSTIAAPSLTAIEHITAASVLRSHVSARSTDAVGRAFATLQARLVLKAGRARARLLFVVVRRLSSRAQNGALLVEQVRAKEKQRSPAPFSPTPGRSSARGLPGTSFSAEEGTGDGGGGC
eukprot:scaffold2586_cov32-Tisochrysis_lutea.AAC.1